MVQIYARSQREYKQELGIELNDLWNVTSAVDAGRNSSMTGARPENRSWAGAGWGRRPPGTFLFLINRKKGTRRVCEGGGTRMRLVDLLCSHGVQFIQRDDRRYTLSPGTVATRCACATLTDHVVLIS